MYSAILILSGPDFTDNNTIKQILIYEGCSRDGSAKKCTNKICRDNHRLILGRQQCLDALAGIKKEVWSGLSLHQIGPRPSINIHQNWMCPFTTFQARAAQRRRPIASNLGQKCLFSDHSKECLGVGFTDLGRTSAFYPCGVPAARLLDSPSTSGFVDLTSTIG